MSAVLAHCSDTAREPDGLPCPGVLTFEPHDLQAKCPVCGGWTGRYAPSLVILSGYTQTAREAQ